MIPAPLRRLRPCQANGTRSLRALASFARRRGARILVERVHHTRGVDERGARIDGNGDTERLRNLFLRCAILDCGFGVNGNAAVTPCRDRHRERNELTDLRPEQICFLTGRTQCDVSLDRVGADMGDFLYPGL